MHDQSLDARLLTQAENATTEAELRNVIAEANKERRGKHLTQTEYDTVLGYARSKIRKLSPSITEQGAGASALTQEESTSAPAPSKAPIGHQLKDLVETQISENEEGPAALIVREPALPIIDAARMGVAMKMWNQLARVIEENTPESLTVIQGKPWRNAEFWRAARLAYGCDRPHITNETHDYTNGRATVTVRLGMGRRTAEGTAVAERSEKGKADAPMNTLVGLAYTRALNRASREVIGLGTKSAEEVESDD